MEKIIGGIELENPISASISQKILWPCYEFIAHAEGLDDFEKNIIEEVVLKLADINVCSDAEIAGCTGLDADLISFMHSRLQQKGWIDGTCRITDDGKLKLGEFSKTKAHDIHIYVDALTGRVIPYWAPVSERNNFHYDGGKWDKKDENNPEKPLFFHYRSFSSAGTEKEEEQTAYQLKFETVADENGASKSKYNKVPEVDEVSAMLHTLFPKNDSIVVRIDEGQSCKKNLCYILMEIMLPEGNSRSWVCTDGFGDLSTFFSTDSITYERDKNFIAGLKNNLQSSTNASVASERVAPKEYPNLAEKLTLVQKNMGALNMFVNSPDKEEELRMARGDAILYMTQSFEWALFYILQKKDFEYKVRKVLADFEKFKTNKNSGFIIGGISSKNAKKIGFVIDADCKKSLRERYGRIRGAFENTPSLFALVELAVLSLDEEKWFKDFAKKHSEFISDLVMLNRKRNRSFHAGDAEADTSELKKVYATMLELLKAGLCVEINDNQELTFAERQLFQNERISAISRMENSLGFALCHLLDNSLLCFYTDMERRSSDANHTDNAVVLSIYQILENIFVSVNECLGDEYKNSDWMQKSRSCGFIFDGTSAFKSLLNTHEDRIQNALERKPSTMNAACIAFMTLADANLLRELKNIWKEMLFDVSYIVHLRGHGEIPDKIDVQRILDIKEHITKTIIFFAKKGFLTRKTIN